MPFGASLLACSAAIQIGLRNIILRDSLNLTRRCASLRTVVATEITKD